MAAEMERLRKEQVWETHDFHFGNMGGGGEAQVELESHSGLAWIIGR